MMEAVISQQHGEEGQHFRFFSIRQPDDESRPAEEQCAIQQRAFDDLQTRNMMRGISGEINGGQPARQENLGIVLERFLLPLKPCAHPKQPAAGQIKQQDFACRSELFRYNSDKRNCRRKPGQSAA